MPTETSHTSPFLNVDAGAVRAGSCRFCESAVTREFVDLGSSPAGQRLSDGRPDTPRRSLSIRCVCSSALDAFSCSCRCRRLPIASSPSTPTFPPTPRAGSVTRRRTPTTSSSASRWTIKPGRRNRQQRWISAAALRRKGNPGAGHRAGSERRGRGGKEGYSNRGGVLR